VHTRVCEFVHAQTCTCCTETQEQNIIQAGSNGQYKRQGRASIYSHGGIANIRTWLEDLQAVFFISQTHRA